MMGSHVAAWTICNGPVPKGTCVCHKCDNPPCVNPSHLFLGTMADNTADMVSKGRNKGAPGESNSHAKLKEVDVVAVRKELELGRRQIDIAKTYGVKQALISKIKCNVVWKKQSKEDIRS
jgi:hypothetical protein